MLVENLKETSLIGQIIVSNHMSCFGIEIQVVKCAKYVAALEEKGKVNESSEKKKKKKIENCCARKLPTQKDKNWT